MPDSFLVIEKNSMEISSIWKLVHIILYLLCVIVSMMLSGSMGTIQSQFEMNCILNSNLMYKPVNDSSIACNIDGVQTKWSKNYADCNTHFMIYLLEFCASVIMLNYFVFLNSGSSSTVYLNSMYSSHHSTTSEMTSSWRIVWIATLINLIGFIVAAVDAKYVTRAVLTLCRSFPDAYLGKAFPCSTQCLSYNDVDQSFLATSFNMLAYLPWVSVVTWGLSLAWCVVRILYHPDFAVYKITEMDELEGMDDPTMAATEEEQQPVPSTSKDH